MTKHYDDLFKARAVSLLMNLKKEGSVVYKENVIESVKSLCLALNISSYSIYSWVKDAGLEVDGKKAKPRPKLNEMVSETFQILGDVEQEQSDLFGIRFWGFVGKNLNIPNYASMPLKQLKLKIGLKLIGQTGLVKLRRSS